MASLIVSGNSGKEFTIHPAGVFAARCTRIVDLGTHDTEWEGKKKKQHMINFSFESAELMGEDEGEYAGKPFLVNQQYTASLGQKSNMRKALESWRGRAFTPAEIESFDLHNVLGKACMVNMLHEPGKKDPSKTYSNIKAIMPLPAGMTAPKAVGELIFFSMSDFDQDTYDKLGEYYKKTIAESDEYKAMFAPKPAASSKPAPKQTAAELQDADIPF